MYHGSILWIHFSILFKCWHHVQLQWQGWCGRVVPNGSCRQLQPSADPRSCFVGDAFRVEIWALFLTSQTCWWRWTKPITAWKSGGVTVQTNPCRREKKEDAYVKLPKNNWAHLCWNTSNANPQIIEPLFTFITAEISKLRILLHFQSCPSLLLPH